VTSLAGEIAAAFRAACRDELEVPKPGNVHVHGAGHRMTAAEFATSAEVAADAIAQRSCRIGARILAAVQATFSAVRTNTNLGIILLAAPLAAAAETRPRDLRAALASRLDDLDIEDATLAFRAIVLASPAGLGRAARHDVFERPAVTLKDAMAEAADRDRIARQYVSAFEDVFRLGLPSLSRGTRFADSKWATLAVYLDFLATFPDSHIVRKHGPTMADDVCCHARRLRSLVASSGDPAQFLSEIMAWDRALKAKNINPGTSADLTVATLFAHRLTNILPAAPNNGSLRTAERIPPLSG
jgi:triphosphoribosyl-dephospho-CoA synthase